MRDKIIQTFLVSASLLIGVSMYVTDCYADTKETKCQNKCTQAYQSCEQWTVNHGGCNEFNGIITSYNKNNDIIKKCKRDGCKKGQELCNQYCGE